MFGPFVTLGDKVWAFAAGGENEPVRVLYELKPAGPATLTHAGARRPAGLTTSAWDAPLSSAPQ